MGLMAWKAENIYIIFMPCFQLY